MNPISSDVLVVGAGLAGFSAAVRACEQDAGVILIDKSAGEMGDGNILMASGSLRAGGKSPRTNPQELYGFVMSEGVAYADLVKAWSETCGRAVDWLINAGVKVTGCTVHFVDNEYDNGPIIWQQPVPVFDDDTADTLAARVFEAEKEAYPHVLRLLAAGRIRLEGRRVRLLPAERSRGPMPPD